MPPKPSQTQPSTSPNPPKSRPGASQGGKIEAWGVPGRQNAPKRCFRPAKRRPRAPKKRPRDAQELPKRDQKPPKSGPEVPKTFQNRSWRPSRAEFCVYAAWIAQRCVSGGCWVDFRSFFASRARWQTCVSYWFFQYKTPLGPFSHRKLAYTKKHRKIEPRDVQNPSRRRQTKSTSGRANSSSDSQFGAQKHKQAKKKRPRGEKCAQETPKSENSVNMAPTCPN